MDTLVSAPKSVNDLEDPPPAVFKALEKLIGYPAENAPKPKPRRTARSRYKEIDVSRAKAEAWPDVIPKLTEVEAIKAGKLLYRWYQRRAHQERGIPIRRGRLKGWPKIKVTSGNRYNWIRGGALIVNPSGGWRRLVHELSHDFHQRLRPQDNPHSDNHRHLEKDMIAHVVSSGWLDGKLKPKPRPVRAAKPKPDPVVVEHERVLARIKTWQTKAKRAETALKKLRKQAARLARKRERTITFTL